MSGAGVSPETSDATVEIPNTLLATFSPRSPLAAIISTEPTGSLTESHVAAVRVSQVGALPAIFNVLTRLGAGLWHLNISYAMVPSPAFTITDMIAGSGDGIRLRNPNASQSIVLLPLMVTSIGTFSKEVTLNLPSDGWELMYQIPAVAALQTVVISANVIASRLT